LKGSEEVHIEKEEGSSSFEHIMLMATTEPNSEDNHLTGHKEWDTKSGTQRVVNWSWFQYQE